MTIDEGYTKFSCDWTRCALPAYEEMVDLLHWRRVLYHAGLIGFYEEHDVGFGNISMRFGMSQEFLITGTQTGHIADVGAAHFSLVTDTDLARNHVTCRGPVQASSESMTHAALYRIDPRINAVVHVHSDILWNCHLGILPTTSPDIAYGTPEMAVEFGRIYDETVFRAGGIAVMGGHDAGLISIGEKMADAALRILDLQNRVCANQKSSD